jgi:hypothetical protein
MASCLLPDKGSEVRVAAKKALVAIAVVGGLASGCAPDSKTMLPVAPSSSGSSSGSQAATRVAVLAAYTGMWSDYQKDLLTANWRNPVSVNHATGEALQDLENSLAVDGHNGWIGKGAPVLSPVIKTVSGAGAAATAEVVDCADLSHFLKYVAATGALEDSTPGGRHLIDAELLVKGGVWKVSTLATGQAGSC